MTMYSRRRSLFNGRTNTAPPMEFIHPVPDRSVSLTVTESLIDGDPLKDYAFIVSDTAYGNPVVLAFIERHSGLENWFVVPGYPYLNADKDIEWKVSRWKDW